MACIVSIYIFLFMIALIILSIASSIITTLSLLGMCVTYNERTDLTFSTSYRSNRNYELWKNNGIIMTIMIMFIVIIWLIFVNLTIAYNLFNCNNGLYQFLNIFFIVVATILTFFILFRKIGLN